MSYPQRSFLFRHRFISTLRDIDVKGIRRLSVALPGLLLPNPEKVGKHILTTIHGVKLLIDPATDSGVELSLFQTGTYEKGTIQLLIEFLKPGNTFLDIGANIGLMTTIAAVLVRENGKVISVEANPKTMEVLQHNVALNHCSNAELLPLALGAHQGTATLFENWNVNRGGASLISQGESSGIPVRLERLDDLFAPTTQIDVVKMDVEGFELQVLAGGKELFTAQHPIFIIEVSTQRTHDKGASAQDVMALVRSFGQYQFFKQKGTKERLGKLIPIHSDKDIPEHDNIICLPISRIS